MEKEQSSNFQVVLDEATRVKDSYGVTRLKMLCGGQRMLSDNFATTITNEFMQQRLARSKDYSIVILKAGPHWNDEGARKIAREHGRRNFALRADGLLPIVCRVTDDSDVTGVGIFNAGVEETKKIMDQDPGVKAGVFIYEIHPCSSFPGDSLPE